MKKSIDKKTNQKINQFLKKALKTSAYKKYPLTREGSSRDYFRIKTHKNSYILAFSSSEIQKKFLKKHLLFSEIINVPKIYFSDLKSNYLLLEDLGDQSLEKKTLKSSSFPLSFYIKALDKLLNFQKTKFFFNRFEDFLKEMLLSEKYLLQCFKLKVEKSLREKYLKEWKDICKKLKSYPVLPSHRDFHSRNLFIKKQKIYLIDFQDAGLFPRFYDLVSLLYDAYVIKKINSSKRERLLKYFLSHYFKPKKNFILKKELITSDLKQEILITSLQRLFKASGSFSSFYVLKAQSTHLKYIEPALKEIEKLLKSVDTYPNFYFLIQKLLKALASKKF